MSLVISTALAALVAQSAVAEEHVVKMLNRGEAGAMVFEPAFIDAEVGDTVRFVPTDRGHNAETVEGMVPDGAEMVVGGMNEEVVIEVTEEGVYGIRCKPHYGMGMVAVIAAGEPVNLEEASEVRAPGRAASTFEELLSRTAKTEG
ncbi:pseudoazurin [Histidinibacterium aquaticum]|uniref:Pseudoazurin n=2 Tax=Histidinibacterium aquaticum TaxID=2613962 RepID=A0A5J5GQT8_9RHOB|nr:pseudoazurin [Histidinibacterium aquaticum]